MTTKRKKFWETDCLEEFSWRHILKLTSSDCEARMADYEARMAEWEEKSEKLRAEKKDVPNPPKSPTQKYGVLSKASRIGRVDWRKWTGPHTGWGLQNDFMAKLREKDSFIPPPLVQNDDLVDNIMAIMVKEIYGANPDRIVLIHRVNPLQKWPVEYYGENDRSFYWGVPQRDHFSFKDIIQMGYIERYNELLMKKVPYDQLCRMYVKMFGAHPCSHLAEKRIEAATKSEGDVGCKQS